MKKSFLFGFAAAVALASCTTNEDVLQVSEQRDLAFGTFVDKATKAPETTLETEGKAFKVWGYYVDGTNGDWSSPNVLWAEGETVTRGASAWGYTNTKQWIPMKQYRFYALAPATIPATCTSGASAEESGKITVTDFTVNSTILDQTDLMVATRYDRNTTTFDNSAINFTFKHVLSKVNVLFNTTSKYDVVLKTVSLSNISGKGTGEFTPSLIGADATDGNKATTYMDVKWTANSESKLTFTGSISETPLPKVDNSNKYVSLQNLLMIPQTFITDQTNNGLYLQMTYTVGGKGDQSATDKTVFTKELKIAGEWKAAHNITYTITIKTGSDTGEGADIVFGVTEVADWETDSAEGSVE